MKNKSELDRMEEERRLAERRRFGRELTNMERQRLDALGGDRRRLGDRRALDIQQAMHRT
jgi:hypothetical protein